jgi:6-phosphogluconate dehydrogenase
MKALDNVNKLSNILLYPELSKKIKDNEKYLRHIIITGIKSSVPVPALMASLAYLDTLRSKWLPANLIQAQRDYFGDHKYQRYDSEGSFHTKW